jgi:hypothetical protein
MKLITAKTMATEFTVEPCDSMIAYNSTQNETENANANANEKKEWISMWFEFATQWGECVPS